MTSEDVLPLQVGKLGQQIVSRVPARQVFQNSLYRIAQAAHRMASRDQIAGSTVMRESRFSFDMIAVYLLNGRNAEAAVQKEMKRRDFYANVTKISTNLT